MRYKNYTLFFSIALLMLSTAVEATEKITIIQIGDLHGQLKPHDNVRSDNTNKDLEGGLARIFTEVKAIRAIADEADRTHWTLLVGDTTHGGVEATYTQGDAMLQILNQFDIDVFTPGNWDFVYGTCRTHEMWDFNAAALTALNAKLQLDCSVPTAPGRLRADFKAIASNAYVDNNRNSANCPAVGSRTRLFDSYQILEDPKTGLKVAIIGFTTERGPRVIGHPVVEGLCFTKGDEEIVELVELMNQKRAAGEVNAVLMISEINLANNRRLINHVDAQLGAGGIDLVMSADMHEETPKILYTDNGTPMVAQGQDGQNIGEIDLTFKDSILTKVSFKQHPIEQAVSEDPAIALQVEAIRQPFLDGSATQTHFVHGRTLPRDIGDLSKTFGIEQPLGIAGIDFNRSNFTHEQSAAIYEGSGHSVITDGLREQVKKILTVKLAAGDLDTGSSAEDLCAEHDVDGKCLGHHPVISVIRGFRYTSSTRAGDPVSLEMLYHYTPIGPYTAAGVVTGAQIRGEGVVNNSSINAGGIEHSAFSALRPDVRNWGGGWLFNWSGLKYDLNPYGGMDNHSYNPATATESVMVGTDAEGFEPLDDGKSYIIVGYGFDKVLYGITSPAPELQFINKPFKVKYVTPNVYRVTYDTDSKSTLDPSNGLDLVGSHFTAAAGAVRSMPVVDLVARYLMTEFGDQNKAVTLVEPAHRVNVLCPLPDMKKVTNTKNATIVDPLHPIVDVDFSMMQSIFGANQNLLQFLNGPDVSQCEANGVL